MPTLSFHASIPLAKAVRRTAARQKRKISELLAEAVERGLKSQQPGALLGCCTDISLPGRPYDPGAPVIPTEDWEMLRP
ncbi:MAG TPA: hypothetical protein VHV47_11470 [Opitutaceae bacterium]|jgi:hypothetical protein|nr:hypothetical protein [Opitutaceae bacterium]